MTANSVVRARIDERTKEEAAAVLAAIGLTVSDAFRLMMVRIAKDKALPFEPLVPNAETVEAIKAARRSELVAAGSPDKLLEKLNAADFSAIGQTAAVDKLVLATVNAPYKRDISAVALRECLARAELGIWLVHVATFFTDVKPDLVFRFAASHGISKSRLAKAYAVMKAATGERNPDLEAELGRLGMVAP